MPEARKGRWATWLVVALVVAPFLLCGGIGFGVWWMVRGLFVTPNNPTNEPEVVHTFPGPLPAALAYSPDGRLLAVLTPSRSDLSVLAPAPDSPLPPTELTVYDLGAGAKAFTATYTRWPKAVAFAPDGRHLVVGLGKYTHPGVDGPSSEVAVYAVPGFAEKNRKQPSPDFSPGRFRFAPDGSLLFAFGTDDTAKPPSVTVWRFPDLTAGPTLPLAMAEPHSASSVNGEILIGGKTKDALAAVERFDGSGKPLGRFAVPPQTYGPVVALLPDPAGKAMTAYYPTGRQRFDPATGQPTGGSTDYPAAGEVVLAVSADGGRVAFLSVVRSSMAPDFRPWYEKGEFLQAVNLTTKAERKWWTGARDPAAAFSPDGRHLAAGYNGTPGGGSTGVRVWVAP